PAALSLEPSQRLTLWAQVFTRFFRWVWAIAILLPLTGLGLIFHKFGGMGTSPLYVHLMLALGVLMVMLYLHVYFAPWRQLRAAVMMQDWAAGAKALASIRRLVGINLTLGLLIVVLVTVGRAGGFA
ncbi:MAG: CopD family protein, partial [Chromatiales bacterium]|nr:CopD family protein [Chromatiales bacterium]